MQIVLVKWIPTVRVDPSWWPLNLSSAQEAYLRWLQVASLTYNTQISIEAKQLRGIPGWKGESCCP